MRQLSGVFFVFGACGVLAVAATAARRMYLGPIGGDEKPKEEVQARSSTPSSTGFYRTCGC